jgi:hypothetical protein
MALVKAILDESGDQAGSLSGRALFVKKVGFDPSAFTMNIASAF